MGAGVGIEPTSRDYKTRIVTTGLPRHTTARYGRVFELFKRLMRRQYSRLM